MRTSSWLFLFTAALVVISSCIVPRRGPAKRLAKAKTVAPFDAIIVPGIPYDGNGWDSVMKARVIWSWILYKNGVAKNVIYSGGPVYTPYTEARVMAMYGQKLGIPKQHIFLDTQARHSTENVFYSYEIARAQGFKSIALATDPFQSMMLRGFTRRRFGTPVYHVPFLVDSLKVYNGLNPVIDASELKERSWTGIKEEQGFWSRMKGTLGKDIDWSNYPHKMLPPL